MPKTIEAMYEDGVFKPLDQVPLPEHTRIRLTLSPTKEPRLQSRYGYLSSEFKQNASISQMV